MAAKNAVPVNDLNFADEVLKSDTPVLVDFSAEWCGPCKALAPIIDQLAVELKGKLKVVALDVDEAPSTAARFSITGVPTVILFKGGQEAARAVGLQPKPRLLAMIENA